MDQTHAAIPHRDWLLEPGRLEKIPLDMIRARPDVRVAGFDGVLASEKAGTPTMKQPCEDLARGALSCLLERMAHPTSSAMRLLRPARLLPRR